MSCTVKNALHVQAPRDCGAPDLPAQSNSPIKFQPFPKRGALASRMNKPFAWLLDSIPASQQQNPVYVYILTTVKVRDHTFEQEGSAPNFQGGRISLCTCKHKDRASPPKWGCRGPDPKEPWKGVWVAGLCSPSQARPRGLFYLMWVKDTFSSYAECWEGLGGPSEKSAHIHPFGDIYEPLPAAFDAPWTKENYKAYLPGHCHDPVRREYDIEESFYGRHPRLLVGDPQRSFLWSRPQITLNARADAGWRTAHHRFYSQLSDFFSLLQ